MPTFFADLAADERPITLDCDVTIGFWPPRADLDLSYYQGADFLIAAADEPTFVASTRRLLGPDSLEIICDEVGAHHVVFGSGSPLQDLEPTVWRLRDARLSATDFAAVAGGTLTSLLEQDS